MLRFFQFINKHKSVKKFRQAFQETDRFLFRIGTINYILQFTREARQRVHQSFGVKMAAPILSKTPLAMRIGTPEAEIQTVFLGFGLRL